ncbi:prepilin-type N-terminal cleavage/methylation domain-containing protein [Herbaspirillum sp. HC18]|nr:prepilin-type N-terminal cleavage/methylation domain-containing protein [Herbaspirillum sp. HC18]
MNRNLQRGFTLVEATIVIVITGIIAAVVAVFIRLPVQGYIDTAARAELVDEADLALRRMARDLRLALPNSIRLSTNGGDAYLEFLLTKTGGRYLAAEDSPTAGFPLRFDPGSTNCAGNDNCKFSVVGAMPAGAQAIVAGDRIVVYNLGPGLPPADAYDAANAAGTNMALVSNVAGTTITLAANPFAAQNVKMRSPSNRFQVVTTPVTYVCSGASLIRYWGYTIQNVQPTTVAALSAGGNARSALLATHLATRAGLTNCAFTYNVLATRTASLVDLRLTLQSPIDANETVSLFHQVHVDNTP